MIPQKEKNLSIKYKLKGTWMPDPSRNNQIFPLTERTKTSNTRKNVVSKFKAYLVKNFHCEGTEKFSNLVSQKIVELMCSKFIL